ncbi:MAG: peptide MFS transporter [Candidatus Korobacteraceae bacterium]
MSETDLNAVGTNADSAASAADTVRRQKTLLGHPVGLFVLFFTEMWERFSYYGMRALLVLYMVDYLIQRAQTGSAHVFGFAMLQHAIESVFGPMKIQPLSSEIYGLYTGFVYLTPFFGGILADRVLGQRKTVVVGGVLMAIGHFLMAIESMFLVALLFLILGNGCFKPNISTQVGSLYPPDDPRRDRAFTIFYMGINLGAFFSPLVCGTLGQVYGWHYGFAAAGVGMVAGLTLYLWGGKYLAEDQLTRTHKAHMEHAKLTPGEWKAIAGLVVLCLLNVIFWGVYEQQGNTIQLFADRNTDWHIFGWELPSTWFQAVNPMFIFLLTPLINLFWGWQSERKKEPSSVSKMALGCLLLGLSFLPLMYITAGLGPAQRISFLWLVGGTFIYTVGELYLSPIGLSLVTKVAPVRLVSMLMGMWFLSSFFGNFLSGYLGTYYEKMSRQSFFLFLAVLGFAAGAAIFALAKPLKNAIGHNV